MMSGGSSETELNEFAVKPTKPPCGPRAVTTVTPVANWDSASRNRRSETAGCGGRSSGLGMMRPCGRFEAGDGRCILGAGCAAVKARASEAGC